MESNTNTDIKAAQLEEAYRKYPIDDHGKLRFAYGKVTAAEALAANGTMALVSLPVGRKRILPHLSRITTSAFGAGRSRDRKRVRYRPQVRYVFENRRYRVRYRSGGHHACERNGRSSDRVLVRISNEGRRNVYTGTGSKSRSV